MNLNTTTGSCSNTHQHTMSFASVAESAHTHSVSGTSAAGSSHTHSLSVSGTTAANSGAANWTPYYIDVIVCTKN